jgi:hypothetical protein
MNDEPFLPVNQAEPSRGRCGCLKSAAQSETTKTLLLILISYAGATFTSIKWMESEMSQTQLRLDLIQYQLSDFSKEFDRIIPGMKDELQRIDNFTRSINLTSIRVELNEMESLSKILTQNFTHLAQSLGNDGPMGTSLAEYFHLGVQNLC